MVFAEHEPCLSKSGSNITKGFQIAFIVGLFVQLGDFINSNIVVIFFRFKQEYEERRFGLTTFFT